MKHGAGQKALTRAGAMALLAIVGLVWVERTRVPSVPRPHLTKESDVSVALPTSPPLNPEWGRCVEIRGVGRSRCIFDPARPMRLWLTHEYAAKVDVFIDGRAVETSRFSAPEMPGIGLELLLPPDARELSLRLDGLEPWSLLLQSIEVPDPSVRERAAVDEFSREIKRAYEEGPGWPEGRTLSLKAIQVALGAGLMSKAQDIALMSAYYLGWRHGRPDLAQEQLDDIREMVVSTPQGGADWAASSGHVLWEQGKISEAARAYRDASRYALRVQDARLIIEALPMYAAALAELGYFSAAARWSNYALEFVVPGSEPHGQVLETAGWVNLMLRVRGLKHTDPVGLYETAIEIFGPDGSFPSPDRIGAAVLGLAEARFLDGDARGARLLLETLDDDRLTLDDRAYRHDLTLRIMLQQEDELEVLHQELFLLHLTANEAVSPVAWWWEDVRHGDVLVRAGRLEDAVLAYRRAEDHLDELTRMAEFGIGRAAVGESHRLSSVRLARALLELGRPAEAFCALREAEGRRALLPPRANVEPRLASHVTAYIRDKAELDTLMSSYDGATVRERREIQQMITDRLESSRATIDAILRSAGRRWSRPRCDELSTRQPGELILGLYPADERWLIFAEDEAATTAFRISRVELPLSEMERAHLATQLLNPIAARIEQASRLRVLAADQAREVDVQVLPWEGRPLLETITVVHGAEVISHPASAWPSQPTAVLVADPTHTLPGAEHEIEMVEEKLGSAGFTVDVIPQDQALLIRVREALEGASLFHFSGHSQYPGVEEHGLWPPYAGGGPATASHLVLAGEQPLAIDDISLTRAPPVVVLLGCEAGALRPTVGGSSVALAFLMGGAQVVVASPTELRDDEAAVFGAELYAHVSSTEYFDAAEALRTAQRATWNSSKEPWTRLGRYRAWVP